MRWRMAASRGPGRNCSHADVWGEISSRPAVRGAGLEHPSRGEAGSGSVCRRPGTQVLEGGERVKLFLSLVVASACSVGVLSLLSGLGDEMDFDDWPVPVPAEVPQIEVETKEGGREISGAEAPTDAEEPLAALRSLRSAEPSGIFPAGIDDGPIRPRDRSGGSRFDSKPGRSGGPGAGDLDTPIGPEPAPTEGQVRPPRVDVPDGNEHTGPRKPAGRTQHARGRRFARARAGHSRAARRAPRRGGTRKGKAGGHPGRRGPQRR